MSTAIKKHIPYTLHEDMCLFRALDRCPEEATMKEVHRVFCRLIQVNTNRRSAGSIAGRTSLLRRRTTDAMRRRIDALRARGIFPLKILEKRKSSLESFQNRHIWTDEETTFLISTIEKTPEASFASILGKMQAHYPGLTKRAIKSKISSLKRANSLPAAYLEARGPARAAVNRTLKHVPPEIKKLAIQILRNSPCIPVRQFNARIRLHPKGSNFTTPRLRNLLSHTLHELPDIHEVRQTDFRFNSQSDVGRELSQKAINTFMQNRHITRHALLKKLFGRIIPEAHSKIRSLFKNRPDILEELKKNKLPRFYWNNERDTFLLEHRNDPIVAAEKYNIPYKSCIDRLNLLKKQAATHAATMNLPKGHTLAELQRCVFIIVEPRKEGFEILDPLLRTRFQTVQAEVKAYSWIHWSESQISTLKMLKPYPERPAALKDLAKSYIKKPPYECFIAYLKYVSRIDF